MRGEYYPDDGDTLEVTEEQDQMSAVHWLDGGGEPKLMVRYNCKCINANFSHN